MPPPLFGCNNSEMIKARVILVVFLIALLWVSMIVRGAYLQLIPNPQFEAIKQKQFNKMVQLSSCRGDILDRDGKELAVSVIAYSLFADPALIKDPYAVAKRLSKHFGTSFKTVHAKLKDKKRRFVWIRRRLENSDYEKIKSWNIRGLAFQEEYRRVYPSKTLAAPVLGFVGREQQGLGGLEKKYESVLSGSGHKVRVQRDARGRVLVEDERIFTMAPEGSDIYLTIDKDLQYWVEQQLQEAVTENEAESAWAVVLNPADSSILAMANYPSFDANQALTVNNMQRRNKTIHDIYETASVMKTFCVGGAIDQGIVQPKTKINTENGMFKIGKRVIKEAEKDHAFKELTVSEILVHSSNVGTSKIALKMTDDVLYKTLLDFGFGSKTGVELPGEGLGMLHKTPWNDHLTANVSFGHGVAVTALQVANAYAAIANGGELNQPYIIKEIRDVEKGEIVVNSKKTIRRVLNEKSTNLLKMMLSSVTAKGGSGYLARIDGYPVAGKTGTAQKVNPHGRGYLPGAYISSFAGFVPANDPKYVIYVVVDSPKKKGYYAATVAAPLFRDIAQFALRRDRTSPSYLTDASMVRQTDSDESVIEHKVERKQLKDLTVAKSQLEIMPELKGLTLKEVLKHLHGQNHDVKIVGQGRVVDTFPEAGQSVGKVIRIQMREPAAEIAQ